MECGADMNIKDLKCDFWNLGTAFNKTDQRNSLIQPAIYLNEYIVYTNHIRLCQFLLQSYEVNTNISSVDKRKLRI